MDYAALVKKFNTRAKGRDYKAWGGSHRLRMREDGTLELICVSKWTQDAAGNYVKRDSETVLALVQPDDTFIPVKDLSTASLTERNIIGEVLRRSSKAAPFACLQTADIGTNKYPVLLTVVPPPARPARPNKTVPYTPNLQYNLSTGEILASDVQIKRKTNRTAAKPAYQYADAVVDTMTVMMRIGAFEGEGYRGYSRKATRSEKFPQSTELTEDVLGDWAVSLYHVARSVYQSPSSWGKKEQNGHITAYRRSDEEMKKAKDEAIIKCARRLVITELKKRINAFEYEEVAA